MTATTHPTSSFEPPHLRLVTPAEATAAVALPTSSLVDRRPGHSSGTGSDERLEALFERRCDGRALHLAVDSPGERLTYGELDARSNRLARYLRLRGAGPGDRIALLFERPAPGYVGMLAALKIGASFLLLDGHAPAEATAQLVSDAAATIMLTHAPLRARAARLGPAAEQIFVDEAARLIGELNAGRLQAIELGRGPAAPTAWIGHSGAPASHEVMAIEHPTMRNAVRVAAAAIGLHDRDRVYSDVEPTSVSAIEHAWMAWSVGATLVPPPADLAHTPLQRYLAEQRVTALFCTPSGLAGLAPDLPGLRLLLVAGESVPAEAVHRWARPGRRIFNADGPTEVTPKAERPALEPVAVDAAPAEHEPTSGTTDTAVPVAAPSRPSADHDELARLRADNARLAAQLQRLLTKLDDGRTAGSPQDARAANENRPGTDPATAAGGVTTNPAGVEDTARLRPQPAAVRTTPATAPAPSPRPRPRPRPQPAALAKAPARVPLATTPSGNPTPVPAAKPATTPAASTPAPATKPATRPVPATKPAMTPAARTPAPAAEPATQFVAFTPAPAPARPPARAPRPVATAFAPAPAGPAAPAPSTEAPLLGALAAVLAEVLGVAQVSADGHFINDLGADSMVLTQFCARLRNRPDLPNVSIKDVYQHHTIRKLATALAPAARPQAGAAAPAGGQAEAAMAAVLAELLEVAQVPVDRHFFDDLGADSMVMAQFCARLRKRPDLPNVAMKDVYQHSTIRALAGALAGPAQAVSQRPVAPAGSVVPKPQPAPAPPVPTSRSKPRYLLCGALQLLAFLGVSFLGSVVSVRSYEWISAGTPTPLDIYLRSALVGGGIFLAACLLPILIKWALIGRWTPRQVPVWSLAYFRFWLVKTVIRANPLVRFVGTPLYVLYLRALGARIGRGVTILSPTVPVATDLLTIGAGTIIRKDSSFTGYRAHSGVIQTGPVTLGRDVYVGESTVLDIATAMGDGAQLGHSSSLHLGEVVPTGARYHGSPAEPTTVNYRRVASTGRGVGRILLPLVQLLVMLGVTLPLSIGGLTLLFSQVPQLIAPVAGPVTVTSWTFYLEALTLGTVLFFGAVLLGLLVVSTVPRLLALFVRPDRDYRLYGVRYLIHRAITKMTNRKFFTRMFGDSSFIVHYLKSIGYDLFQVEQTGSNFGTDVKHESPFLSSVGSGTVVADGLSIVNADFSNTHFRVSRVSIGAHNFLGNRIVYPVGGRTGDNCLLATKVMVPLDGPVREGVGLLGSPSFEIPRTVDRDKGLDVTSPEELRRRLSAKNRHNALSIVLFLISRWIYVCALTTLAMATFSLYSAFGLLAMATANLLVLPFTALYFVLLDRLVRGMQARRPNGCSIYDRAFWRHERFWKICADAYLNIFNGTPFKNVLWRMLGVRIGRRVFDDGCFLTERSFVTIGDHCTLNAGSVIQCHSQEDGAFKSDHTVIGDGSTLGVNAFVHYGVTIGIGAQLEPDSFLMKGEEVPSFARWGGNPAMEIEAGPPGIQHDQTTPDDRLIAA